MSKREQEKEKENVSEDFITLFYQTLFPKYELILIFT